MTLDPLSLLVGMAFGTLLLRPIRRSGNRSEPDAWRHAPDDAPADAAGTLGIRNLPGPWIELDGVEVTPTAGARGFHGVPPGPHQVVGRDTHGGEP